MAVNLFATAEEGSSEWVWSAVLAVAAGLNTARSPLKVAEQHRVSRAGFVKLVRRYREFRDATSVAISDYGELERVWGALTQQHEALEDNSPEIGGLARRLVARRLPECRE